MNIQHRQQGLSLVVALIMLVIMTATTLALFRMSQTGNQIAGNMQFAEEAISSADGAIQEVISTRRMFETPNQIFLTQCNGSFNSRCFDLDGDGQDDIEVVVQPPNCVQAYILPTASLNLADPRQLACTRDTPQLFAIEGLSPGDSLCANTIWDVIADAMDFDSSGVTGAQMRVVEGIGIQVPSATALGFCSGPVPTPAP